MTALKRTLAAAIVATGVAGAVEAQAQSTLPGGGCNGQPNCPVSPPPPPPTPTPVVNNNTNNNTNNNVNNNSQNQSQSQGQSQSMSNYTKYPRHIPGAVAPSIAAGNCQNAFSIGVPYFSAGMSTPNEKCKVFDGGVAIVVSNGSLLDKGAGWSMIRESYDTADRAIARTLKNAQNPVINRLAARFNSGLFYAAKDGEIGASAVKTTVSFDAPRSSKPRRVAAPKAPKCGC